MPLQSFTMPPPSGGLDLVTPIDQMDPSYALELVNVFPGAGGPSVRKGYYQLASTGSSAPLGFAKELPLADGTSQLIVANSTNLYSISSGGVVTNITNAVPHTSSAFNDTIFSNKMYLCNGVDSAQVYTGTGIAQDLAFTPVALANLVSVSSYRERLWFVERNTLVAWYGGVQSTGVAASALTSNDFQFVMKQGGYLLHVGSYSNQTGTTAQDLLFACSSEGEIVFYQGSSPADVANWSITARFVIGRPLGFRAFIRVNQDIWILTQQGIIPVSSLFQTDPQQAARLVSDKVNPLIATAAAAIPFSSAWGGFLWAGGRRVYITIPVTGTTSYFLVYSLDTKGWTKFQLYDNGHALSSCTFINLPLYASATGVVYKGETGLAEAASSTSSGQAMTFSSRSAFSFFEQRGSFKAFKDIRPILKSKRGLTLNLGLDTDFKRQATVTTATTGAGTFTAWGSPWGSPWSSDVEYIFDRFAVKGQGHSAAIRFGGSIKGSPCDILSFEIRFDLGGQV